MKEPKEPTPEMDKGKNSSGFENQFSKSLKLWFSSTIAAESSSNLDQLSANGKMHNGHSDWAMNEKSEKIDKSDDENSIAELRKKLLSSTSSNKLEERFLVNGEVRIVEILSSRDWSLASSFGSVKSNEWIHQWQWQLFEWSSWRIVLKFAEWNSTVSQSQPSQCYPWQKTRPDLWRFDNLI